MIPCMQTDDTYNFGLHWYHLNHRNDVVKSLTAIDAHERQLLNKLCGTVVSCQIFIRSQSLIVR